MTWNTWTPPTRAVWPRLAGRVLLLLALCSAWAAQAQWLIGQTAGHTGAVAATVKEATAGAQLYFDAVNQRGGIAGKPIELVSLDDKFEPKLAAQNARKLIDDGAIALFLTRGTPHNEAILPLLAEAKVPLVGPSTGAMLLHQPVNRWVFNVRATYQREAERLVRHLMQFGVQRLGIVQVADSFGEDAVVGALRGLDKGRTPAVHATYDRSKPDFSTIVPKLMQADVQAVLFIGSGTAVVDGMRGLRAAGSRAQLLTLSNNASAGFVKALGADARGVVVSQVLPPERSMASPLVKEATDLAAARGSTAPPITPALLEGFASAKVLVEGLKRAVVAGKINGASLQRALEGLQRFDIGGLEVSYSPSDHTGLDYADLSIIDAEGRFKR